MGFEPTGFEISITYGIPSPQYYFYLGFFIKNLLSILLATTMYVIGMNLLFFKVFQQKVELISLIPGIREKFQKFKSIHRATIVPFVMIHLVVALHGLDYWLISQEFPYYNPTALNGFVLVPYAFIFYFILISIPAILEEKAYRQSRQILAEVITPLLEKELVNNKPLIQIWNFKNELGLESVDRKDFRLVLKNSLKMIEMKENIHFGFLINYFYIVEPLVDIAREKIGRDGQADIEEIANEITVHWANLKEAYKKIKKEKLFENVKIVRGKILPIYHGTSI
ncbi:MAG: hypothetical protein ACUVXA_18300 [Candidatus Jordarchaeum sp.]|uniref:hypothetical protein n=1 Tax=Candidatus Jordarchaeum sp. TaxID=2823881 RepID=UPI00404997B9